MGKKLRIVSSEIDEEIPTKSCCPTWISVVKGKNVAYLFVATLWLRYRLRGSSQKICTPED